jgi:ketosteroid isomerase-like protein
MEPGTGGVTANHQPRGFACQFASGCSRASGTHVGQSCSMASENARRSELRRVRGGCPGGLRDTPRTMSEDPRMTSEDSTTPELVRLTRESIETEDLDAALSFYAPHAVWDASPWGMGVFEGEAAMRGFFEDWRASYSGIERTAEEIRDLGSGVTFAVILQKGRVVGSGGSVQLRYGSVAEWIDDLMVRNTTYTDIDEARTAAERLAEERR